MINTDKSKSGVYAWREGCWASTGCGEQSAVNGTNAKAASQMNANASESHAYACDVHMAEAYTWQERCGASVEHGKWGQCECSNWEECDAGELYVKNRRDECKCSERGERKCR